MPGQLYFSIKHFWGATTTRQVARLPRGGGRAYPSPPATTWPKFTAANSPPIALTALSAQPKAELRSFTKKFVVPGTLYLATVQTATERSKARKTYFSASLLGYVQLRGVGRWMPASSAAYPTTPYPLRWAWPGTHPTPAPGCWRCSSPSVAARWWARWGGLHSPAELPRPSPSAGARAPRAVRAGWRRWASASRRRRRSEPTMGKNA